MDPLDWQWLGIFLAGVVSLIGFGRTCFAIALLVALDYGLLGGTMLVVYLVVSIGIDWSIVSKAVSKH